MDVICHHDVALLPRLDAGVGFEFCGRIKENTVVTLLKWTETLIEPEAWQVNKRKRFVRCLIELTQNLSKHGMSGRFCCHIANGGTATLKTSNVVSAERRSHLGEVLRETQSTAFENLKAERMDKLVHGERTAGGGAGLGFMDMRACSNDNLHSEFIPCDNGAFIFELTVSFPS